MSLDTRDEFSDAPRETERKDEIGATAGGATCNRDGANRLSGLFVRGW